MIQTTRFAIETDAAGMRRMGPDVLAAQLLDLRAEVGSMPFTTPNVVGIRLLCEVDVEVPGDAPEPEPEKPAAKGKTAKAKG
ncbi:MAG: hypothetical protein AB7O45_02725 [Alphaproteobacteria bacterium]